MINEEQLKEIAKAILNNQDYSFNEDGLNIQAKSSDNGFQIQMSYSEPKEDLTKKEKEDFETWVKTIDDEIFTGVCEYIGGEEITKISNCLNSSNLESVRSGSLKFKSSLRQYLINKIEYYKQCLHNLLKLV